MDAANVLCCQSKEPEEVFHPHHIHDKSFPSLEVGHRTKHASHSQVRSQRFLKDNSQHGLQMRPGSTPSEQKLKMTVAYEQQLPDKKFGENRTNTAQRELENKCITVASTWSAANSKRGGNFRLPLSLLGLQRSYLIDGVISSHRSLPLRRHA